MNLSANYTIINDIDASETRNWNGGLGFEPIAKDTKSTIWFQGAEFCGSMDGKGYNITGLFINRTSSDYVALFGFLDEEGSLTNINLVDANIRGKDTVAGLVGRIYWKVKVSNCSITGDIQGNYDVGGLIAVNSACSVINCSFSGNVSGNDEVGGLIADNYGSVFNCTAINFVKGRDGVGGLTGISRGGILFNCSVRGNIIGNRSVGGFVGSSSYCVISFCQFSGNVSGSLYVGGFTGFSGKTISDCSSNGVVIGNDCVGGFIGYYQGGLISNCYFLGNITGFKNIGGFYGFSKYSVSIMNSFYCINNTKINGHNIVTPFGIYKRQFDDWIEDRIILLDDYMTRVSGTDYYGIKIISDLKTMLPFATMGYKFKLMTDLDLNQEPGFFVPIFLGGVFDGNRKNISNLNVTQEYNDQIGMFGYTGRGSEISNVSLNNCHVSGKNLTGILIGKGYSNVISNCTIDGTANGNSHVGGLVGEISYGIISNCNLVVQIIGKISTGGLAGYVCDSTISDCQENGKIIGNIAVGGLIGRNDYSCILKCNTSGYVEGNENIGGLIGDNNGFIDYVSESTFIGNVAGDNNIGGLIGFNGGDIINCYMKGTVSGNQNNIGGLVGYNDKYCSIWRSYSISDINGNHSYTGGLVGFNNGYISNSYALGNASGNYHVGGLIGYNNDSIYHCYSLVSLSQTNFVGAFVGLNYGSIENSFYEYDRNPIIQGIGYGDAKGVIGLSQTKMLQRSTFIDAEWNYGDIWDQGDNQTYPFLQWEPNLVPEILTTDITSATEDIPYNNDYNCLDPDRTDIVQFWSLQTNATFLSINKTTGVLYGTPLDMDGGSKKWVNVSVSDGRNSYDYTNFTLEIKNIDDMPIGKNISICLSEDTTMTIDIREFFYNPDNHPLQFSISNQSNIRLNLTGTALDISPEKDWNGLENVTIEVIDGAYHLNAILTVHVLPVNDQPMFTSLPSTIATIEQLWSYIPTILDIDGDNVIISLISGPLGMNISNATLQWMPNITGIVLVNLSAIAGNDTIYQEFAINVTEKPPTNDDTDEGSSRATLALIIIVIILVIILSIVAFVAIKRRIKPHNKKRKKISIKNSRKTSDVEDHPEDLNQKMDNLSESTAHKTSSKSIKSNNGKKRNNDKTKSKKTKPGSALSKVDVPDEEITMKEGSEENENTPIIESEVPVLSELDVSDNSQDVDKIAENESPDEENSEIETQRQESKEVEEEMQEKGDVDKSVN